MRSRAIITSVVTVSVALLGIVAAMLFTSTNAYAAGTNQQVWLTYYGYYDNTPPGCAISYPQIHSCAGGTGTYSDPITFATDQSEAAAGTIVYVPRVEKYFIMEDDCTECDQDWSGHGPDGGPNMWHFDLWLGGQGGNEMAAINCEDALTQSNANGSPKPENVVINPPGNETVSSEPLFNTSTGACYGGAQAGSTTGQYKNNSTGTCLTDPGNSSSPGTAVDAAACTGGADQQFTYQGAFLSINNLCVDNPSGSTLSLASCSGGPTQQWSVNTNGTIEDIQTSTKCFRASGSTVTAGSCSGTAAQWTFSGSTSSPSASPSSSPSTSPSASPSSSPSASPSSSPSSGNCASAQLLGNPGFENGTNTAPWTQSSTLGFTPITQATSAEPAHSGSWIAWFNGNGSKDTDTIAQNVTIPAGCTATLSYWLHIDTTENTTTAKPDTYTVQVLNASGTVLATVGSFSNLNKASGYTQHSADLSAYAGQTVTLKFSGTETDTNGGTTNFVLDDTALNVSGGTVAPNDFSISDSPSSGSVTAGSSATTTVSTAVTSGAAQTVALSASGLPSGASASFSPGSVSSGGSSTLTIATTSNTAAGTYPVTVTGTAASGSHTATFTLTVTAPSGGCTAAQLLANPGFESGATGWTQTSTLGFYPITQATSAEPAHSGSWIGWFNGNGSKDTDTIAQNVTIPTGCTATLSYWLHIDTTENTTTSSPDTYTVQVLNASGTVLATVGSFSNLNKASGYTQHSANLSAYAGQSVTLKFIGSETDTNGGTTNFVLDDTALNTN